MNSKQLLADDLPTALAEASQTILQLHERWLISGKKQGASASHQIEKLLCEDLRWENLSQLKIANLDFSKAQLEGTDFSNSAFDHLMLRAMSLFWVDFRRLQGRNLVFDRSVLWWSSFSDASLNTVSFRNANLNDVNFHASRLVDCDFSGTSIEGVDFSQTYLIRPVLKDIKHITKIGPLLGSTWISPKHLSPVHAKLLKKRGAEIVE